MMPFFIYTRPHSHCLYAAYHACMLLTVPCTVHAMYIQNGTMLLQVQRKKRMTRKINTGIEQGFAGLKRLLQSLCYLTEAEVSHSFSIR